MEWKKLYLFLANHNQTLATLALIAFIVLLMLISGFRLLVLLGFLFLIIPYGIRRFFQNRRPYLLSQIVVSRRFDKKEIERDEFESRLHLVFEFFSKKEKNKFSDDKIKQITLDRLVDILQKSAQEIVSSYFITITVEESVKGLEKGKCCFRTECAVWTKKKPEVKRKPEREREKDPISVSLLARDF